MVKSRGRPGSTHHVSGYEVDVGGRGADIQIRMHVLKVGLLSVNMNVWSADQ